MKLDNFFNPKTVAVIGASRNKEKIGFTVFKNFKDNFGKNAFPINLKAKEILGNKAYASVLDVPKKIDLAVVVTPAKFVSLVLKQCIEKKIKNAVIITSGFGEIGNKDLENELKELSKHIRIIGPNCLGTFDNYSGLDCLFLPPEKLGRPRKGSIAFISQSGAVGSVVLDWMSAEGYGVSKFVSYGNAVDVNEADLLEYFGNDKDTKVICMYIEGVKQGPRFMKVAKKVSKKKPIIVIKGGRTAQGSKAVSSHTGSLAGEDSVYDAAFEQTGVIRARHLVEMFNFARVLSEQPLPKGDRVLVITNGGGFGVLATDEVILKKLKLAKLSDKSKKAIKKALPSYASAGNPLDLVGDADDLRFKRALEIAEKDKNVDAIMCILLFQTAPITEKVVDYVIRFSKKKTKPLVVCSAGGDYVKKLVRKLEENDIPVFDAPARAVDSVDALVDYANIRKGKAWTYD